MMEKLLAQIRQPCHQRSVFYDYYDNSINIQNMYDVVFGKWNALLHGMKSQWKYFKQVITALFKNLLEQPGNLGILPHLSKLLYIEQFIFI